MTFLIVFLVLVSIVAFLLFVNVHLIFCYENKAEVTLRILFFRFDAIRLFRRFTSDKKAPSEEPLAEESVPSKGSKKRKGSPLDFAEFLLEIGKIIALAIKEHFERMKVYLKMLYVEIGSDDAAKTACLYGAAIQAANALCVLLQHFSNFRCDNERLLICPNFTSEESKLSIHLDLCVKPIHLIGILIRSYFRFFERKENNHA